jgi:hypothetical protein
MRHPELVREEQILALALIPSKRDAILSPALAQRILATGIRGRYRHYPIFFGSVY